MNQLLDERDLQQIMHEHKDYLLRLKILYVKDWPATEDIVQDVFISFYQKFEQFEERSSLKTYLTKITVNKCKDYLKSWRYRMHILTNSFWSKSTNHHNRLIEQDE